MSKIYKIYDVQNKKYLEWDTEQMLAEINRMVNKDKDFLIKGWNVWVENNGDYECRGIANWGVSDE
jgi:hypothetical protein